MEKLVFKNRNGQKIVGILSDPRSDTVVMLCHGLGFNKESPRYKALQSSINKLGLATFRFDFLGHGESEGQYEDLTLSEATDNILKAKSFLRGRFKHFGFVGSSMGAVSGIMAGAREKFSFMIFISPPTHYDFTEIITSGYYLYKELRRFRKAKKDSKKTGIKISFFRDYGSQDSYDAASRIQCPVLIIQGDEDKIVPLAKSRELNKKMKNSKIKIFKGVDHLYSHPVAKEKLIKEVVKFVLEHAP